MTDRIAADLQEAHQAVQNLVNLFFDRVTPDEFAADPAAGRENLAECVHEGLSDEWTRLYRIAAAQQPESDSDEFSYEERQRTGRNAGVF